MTQLRLPGNHTFLPGDLNLTIDEWFTKYSVPELQNTYIVPPQTGLASVKKRTKTFRDGIIVPRAFSVELFVRVGEKVLSIIFHTN